MTAGVYAIINTGDGAVYVGSSTDIAARWVSHRHTFAGDAYEWTILEEVEPTPDTLEAAEQRWMDYYEERLCNTRKTAKRQRPNRLYLDLNGVRLQERREALGLSINGLAREFRVNPSSVQRWEAGKIDLQGLMAHGADAVLKQLEVRQRRSQQ